MAKKKTEETVEAVESAVEEIVAAEAAENTEPVAASGDVTDASAESTEIAEAAVAEKPKKTTLAGGDKTPAETSEADSAGTTSEARKGKRAEKIGVVSSDKMTKTVVVRVDRLVKHPIYRKYVRRRKKFMAHDEMGAKIGDKVRIVETRPLSARKRWRVVEIIQKAEL